MHIQNEQDKSFRDTGTEVLSQSSGSGLDSGTFKWIVKG